MRVLTAVLFAFCFSAPALSLDLELDGKRALISGSTSGIGYAIARTLLEEGAEVIINGRSQESVDRAIASLSAETGRAPLGFPADMSTAEGTQAIFAAYPEIDILVNNVGTYGPSAFEESTDEDWYRLFDLNVMSGVRLSRLYLPHMRAQEEAGGDLREIERQFFVNVRPTSLLMRFADPAEVAAMVAYVVSAKASATTGAALRVDGGTIKSAF